MQRRSVDYVAQARHSVCELLRQRDGTGAGLEESAAAQLMVDKVLDSLREILPCMGTMQVCAHLTFKQSCRIMYNAVRSSVWMHSQNNDRAIQHLVKQIPPLSEIFGSFVRGGAYGEPCQQHTGRRFQSVSSLQDIEIDVLVGS